MLQLRFKVLIAACDTFRSGAVEQLKVHSDCLGVPVFDRGYKRDPAHVAKEAIEYAKQKGYSYTEVKRNVRKVQPKSYADNFAYSRMEPWTH